MDSDFLHCLLENLSKENGSLKISHLIVHYLSKHFSLDYEWSDIETLMKMFVVFRDSISANGDQFVQLSDEDRWFFESSFKNIYNEELKCPNFEIIIENIILKSANSLKSGIILDNLLTYIKKNLDCNIQLGTLSNRVKNVNANRKNMYSLIERIFILPSSDIENSIETIIKHVGFEILGYVFCESPTSIYFDKCAIVSDVICNKLETSHESIMSSFMPSIITSLQSKKGKSLFKKCLENKHFSFSLNLFLKDYLINLKNGFKNERDRNTYLSCCQMSYIIYMNFNEINNRNLEIYAELNENNFLRDYLTNINIIFS